MDKPPISETDSTLNQNASNTEKAIPAVTTRVDEDDQPRDATDEEIQTFRHVNDTIPLAAWIVILAGAAERATYFGIIAPWRMSRHVLAL